MKTNQEYKWLGLSSYEESDSSIFYGRTKEIDDLSTNILFNIQTIIYGPSGIGKTSLLRAGIFEKLRPKNFFPVYIRIDVESEIPYTQQIIFEIESELFKINGEKEVLVKELGNVVSLWEYFHGTQFWDSKNFQLIPLIVIDQFEELFTLSTKQDRIEEFFGQLADLCNAKMPDSVKESLVSKGIRSPYLECNDSYRLVISLREDFLPRMEECSTEIPAFKSNRYSLQALSEDQAMEIILKPGHDVVSEEVAAAIVSKLSYKSNYKIAGHRDKIVEPALLSLFCHELDKRRLERHEEKISKNLLNELGDNIIYDYYNDTISNISPSSAEYLEDVLMTKDGFRDNVSVQDALSSGLKREELDYLLKRRLVREEEWSGIKRLEYTHDVLCKVAKERRDNREEERRIEEEKKKNELLQIELGKRKRKTQFLILATILLALLVAGIYWAFFSLKVSYYEDVIFRYEWPEGINSISESQVKLRPLSYKFEKKGALSAHWTKVTAINGLFLPNTDNTFNQVFLETDSESLSNIDKKYQKKLRDITTWEFISDASNLNVIQQKAYNRKGELVYSFSFTDNKFVGGKLRGCIGIYTNALGYPIQSYKNGANNVKISLDENGYRCLVEFYDAWGNKDRDNNCVYSYKMESSSDGLLETRGAVNDAGIYVYDSNNNSLIKYLYKGCKLIEQQFCDPNGNLTNNSYGYAIEKREYDRENRVLTKSYYDKALVKVKVSKMQDSPYHKVKYAYDSRGFISEVSYFDIDNNPIKKGYAYVKYISDKNGMIEKCCYYTYDGKNYVCADSTSGYLSEYNDDNDYALVTLKTNIGKDSTPSPDLYGVVSYKYEYDEKGNLLSVINLDLEGNKVNNKTGYAEVRYKYDDKDNLVSRSYYGINNELVVNNDKGYSTVNYSYDNRGNLTQESFFDNLSKPVIIGEAQTYEYEYDRFNNKTKTVYKGLNGKNVPDKIITIDEYDPFGSIVSSENFKSDEKTPTNGLEGWHKKEIIYDRNNFKSEEIFYDVSGFVLNTPGKPYAVKHTENDEYGNITSISYFDEMMEPIQYEGSYKDTIIYENNRMLKKIALDDKSNTLFTTEYKYNDYNKLSELSYKDKDGNNMMYNGISSKVIDYLDNGDITITYFQKDKVSKTDTVKADSKIPYNVLVSSNAIPEYKVVSTKNWKYEGYMLNDVPCGAGRFTWYEAGYYIEGYFNSWNVIVNSWKGEIDDDIED